MEETSAVAFCRAAGIEDIRKLVIEDVIWLCSLVIALMTSPFFPGAQAYPIRQPVMAKVLLRPLIVMVCYAIAGTLAMER